MKTIQSNAVSTDAQGKDRLDLYSDTFSGRNGKEDFTGYVITYLSADTHYDEETGTEKPCFYANQSEYYLTLEEAQAAYDQRLASENPFKANASFTFMKNHEFQNGPK